MMQCCKTSSVVLKAVVAVTGLLLIGFVMGHLAGNLTIFAGQHALNAYAKKLQSLGPLLWVVRLGLLSVFLVHIGATILLVRRNREARPIGYSVKKTLKTTPAAKTMILSGLVVIAFVFYHLLHFTFRVTHPSVSHLKDPQGYHDVFSMVVLSFRDWPISLSYAFAMLLLGFHLSHGIASIFQTLGFAKKQCWPKIQCAGRGLAILITLGYMSIPLSVLFGLVKAVHGGS